MIMSGSSSNEDLSIDSNEPGIGKLKVIWTILNRDLGTHHNTFIAEFPKCLFVRVLSCGPQCRLQKEGPGGVALIREKVLAANAKRMLGSGGKFIIDRDSPFIISEEDVLAFGKFETMDS